MTAEVGQTFQFAFSTTNYFQEKLRRTLKTATFRVNDLVATVANWKVCATLTVF
jgi:3-methyladenine DNA glycosylase AlkD